MSTRKEIVILDVDDDSSPSPSAPAHQCSTHNYNNSNKKRSETIVLLDDTNNHVHAAYEASTLQAFASDKTPRPQVARKRNKTQQQLQPASTGDAIDVEALPSNDPSAVYRRMLGPLRFEFMDTLKHHSFLAQSKPMPHQEMPKIYKELLEYRLNLPSEVSGSIFVRALESKMNILRALITGPEDTPYANGCFLFDICLTDYPKTPPKFKFLTTGGGAVRFNPNLYNCGKVCLSLLGTWHGPGWIPNQSTLLQVLVSIQGLILVPEPYYNEPGHTKSPVFDKASAAYTERTRQYTLKHAIEGYLDLLLTNDNKTASYSEFYTIMQRHYCLRASAICDMMDIWLASDKSLAAIVERIRAKLDQLLLQYGHALQHQEQDDTRDTKPAARKKEPEVLVID